MRAYLTGLIVSAGLAGVGVRAWALQVDDGDRYRALAERQHAQLLHIPAPRGDVLDAHGRPLAVSADAESIWANPHEVRDVAATADKLASLVGGDASALEAKLAGDHKFVWIERHVAPELARAVQGAKLPGIEVAREPRRWYPARATGGTVIGRADIDGNGLDGIELAMNDVLAGRRSEVSALRDARGHKLLADGLSEDDPGATVRLSLDRSIQAIAETSLEAAVTANKAKSGVAVVLEVGTGRVLALASSPNYDPNGGDSSGARDKPVTDAFEAGSVMKVFSVATALDAGVVQPETEFEIGSVLMVGNRPIHDTHVFPYLTVGGIIKHSSNIGAGKIALRMGADKLYDGLKRFGFGAKTGIEMPGEQVGMLREPAKWRDIDLAHMAFGYGLTVTPLQIAAALSAIGNHGVYHAPRIVDEVVDRDGTVLYRPESLEHQAISDKAASQMLVMLASVFDKGKEGGTAGSVDVAGFKCGGKTGTAYKFDTQLKHYTTDHYLASFAGLAPIDHPRLAIVVMIDDPAAGEHYGGQVSAPAFAAIASETLRYLGVPGDPLPPPPPNPSAKPAKPAPPPPPAPEPLSLAKALDLARENHLPVALHGTGQLVRQEAVADHLDLYFSDEPAR